RAPAHPRRPGARARGGRLARPPPAASRLAAPAHRRDGRLVRGPADRLLRRQRPAAAGLEAAARLGVLGAAGTGRRAAHRPRPRAAPRVTPGRPTPRAASGPALRASRKGQAAAPVANSVVYVLARSMVWPLTPGSNASRTFRTVCGPPVGMTPSRVYMAFSASRALT